MSRDQRRFLALQLALGPTVLGSYVYGFAFWPDALAAMWGGVPDAMRGVYTAWMFVAAAGYLVLAPALFLHAASAPLPGAWRIAAPLGAAAFCVQTVLLDAIVWPLFWE